MIKNQLRLFYLVTCILALALSNSCSYDFGDVPEGAQITCKDTADCPSGWLCKSGMCVKAANVDSDPPKIVGEIAVTPPLLKSGATAAITFEVSEALEKDPELTIKLGNNFAPINGKNIGGNNYEFTYTAQGKGVEPEEINCPITIALTDKAKNTNEIRASLTFDFTPPQVLASEASKNMYKNGDTILYTLNVSKQLAGRPVLAVLRDGAAFPVFDAPVFDTLTSFTYARLVEEGMDGAYTMSATLTDKAGNMSSGVACNGWKIDATRPDITGNSVIPTAAKDGDTVTIIFTATKELAKAPTIRLGAITLDTGVDCIEAASKTYTCTHKASKAEGDGPKKAEVDLADPAGNTNTVTIGSVDYDVTAPSLVSVNLLRDPYFAPYNTSGSNTYYFSVKDPMTEGPVKATLIVYASETLDTSAVKPSVEVIGPRALEFVESGSSGKAAVFTYTIKDTDPEGNYTFNVTWTDLVGNPSTAAVPVNLIISKTPPALTAIDMTKVTYKRIPWGMRDPNNQSVWIQPTLSVSGAANAITDKSAVSAIYIYKGSSSDPGQSPSTVPGNLIGTTDIINTDGSFSIQELSTNDLPVIHMALVDRAGVKSAAHLIKNIKWIASIGNKVSGSTYENPNILQTCGHLLSYLISDDLTCYDPSQSELDNFQKTAADAITRTVDGSWFNYSLNGKSPSSRTGHAMVYEIERGTVIMFGGYIGNGATDNETWEWNGDASEWIKRIPNGVSPSTRHYHAMAYDRGRGKVVMFGGMSNNNETWEWDGTAGTWTKQVPTTSPSGRYDHAMAYDTARGKVVMFGGSSGGDETWEWDGTAGTWTKRTPPTSPSGRTSHSMAYDIARGKIVMFGGYAGNFLNDLWEWDGAAGAWTKRTTSISPSARARFAMSYNIRTGRVMMFGGDTESMSTNNETWEWNGLTGVWVNKTPTGKIPNARYDYSMIYDSGRKKVVIFGGSPSFKQDTWEWDGEAGTWADRTPGTNPSGRYGHAMAYDVSRAKTMMFGGYIFGAFNNETWEWDGTAGTWTKKTPALSPSARFYHAMAYDSTRKKVVMFGGGSEDSLNNETWEWDGAAGTWTKRSPATSPSGRYMHAMAYDNGRGKVVLFGGNSDSLNNETWEWDGVAGTWTRMSPSTSPSGRYNHAMAYDNNRRKVVMFGGHTGQKNSETWEWDGTSGTWANRSQLWTNPYVRVGHALAYDNTRGKTVMFGGFTNAGENDETWEWEGGASKDPAHLFHAHFYSAVLENAYSIKSISSSFQAGGAGYPDFILVNTPATWSQASTACQAMGAGVHLATIGSIAEQRRVAAIAGEYITWIGGTDEGHEGTWTWVDGTVMSYSNWNTGEPNNSGGENCMQMYNAANSYKWNDAKCSNVLPYVCEYPSTIITRGARIKPWIEYQWAPVTDSSAKNTSDPASPGPLSWSTSDPATIQRMLFGPQKYISFAVTPVAVNGTGIGQIALKDARVTVNYKLCVDEGDCP